MLFSLSPPICHNLKTKLPFTFLDFGRSFSLLKGVYLESGTGDVWRKAFESQFSEQQLFNNVAAVVGNLIIRVTGWMLLEVVLYGGEHILRSSDSNKESP